MPKIEIDLSDVETSEAGQGSWEALAPGEYRMMVLTAEMKEMSSGNGERLALEMNVVGGEEKGRTHWESFNIIHTNDTTVRIAKAYLAMLSDAVGLPRDFLKSSGTESLVGKVVLADMSRTKAKNPDFGDANGFENRIRSYSSINGMQKKAATRETPATSSDDVPF